MYSYQLKRQSVVFAYELRQGGGVLCDFTDRNRYNFGANCAFGQLPDRN